MPRKTFPKTCVICGKLFDAKWDKVTTCSYECGYVLVRQKMAIKREERCFIPPGVVDRRSPTAKDHTPYFRNCDYCGIPIAVQKNSSIITCSRKCSTLSKRKRYDLIGFVEHTCQQCGKSFNHRYVSTKIPQFCSDQCRQDALNIKNRAERHKMTTTCLTCGKVFEISRRTQKWCSRACMWSDMDYVARRAQAMSGLREGKKPTRLEQWLFDALHQIQIDFIPYAPVERFIADALIPIHKIIIEVDGERWHSQWKSRDILRDRILASYGYTTVRFSDRNLTSESTAIQVLINGIQEVINLQHSTGNPTPGSLYKVFWSRSVFQEKRRESSMNETPDIVLHSS